MLECAFPRRLRYLAAALWLCGAALAGFTAPLAFVRTGVISSLPFLFALALLVVLAVETFQGARLALVASMALLGAQLLGIVGSALQLMQGDSAKAAQPRSLGLDPTVGLCLSLIYSAIAFGVFMRLVVNWYRCRQRGVK